MFCTAFSPRIALMAYWTCQFTFSWVCESPPCCERSYHYEQLTASRAVHSLNTSAEFSQGSIFPWTETFHPEEGFLVLDGAQDAESRCWCWSSANMCRRPGTRMVRMNREREKCLLFRCEFQMGGRAIKSIRPELSLQVKARGLSDKHIHMQRCSFFGNIFKL